MYKYKCVLKQFAQMVGMSKDRTNKSAQNVKSGKNKEKRENKDEVQEWSENCFKDLGPEYRGGCQEYKEKIRYETRGIWGIKCYQWVEPGHFKWLGDHGKVFEAWVWIGGSGFIALYMTTSMWMSENNAIFSSVPGAISVKQEMYDGDCLEDRT